MSCNKVVIIIAALRETTRGAREAARAGRARGAGRAVPAAGRARRRRAAARRRHVPGLREDSLRGPRLNPQPTTRNTDPDSFLYTLIHIVHSMYTHL